MLQIRLPVEVYVRSPTLFILQNRTRLLPDWSYPPQAVAIFLLQSQWQLNREDDTIQLEKTRLRTQFIQLGQYFQVECYQKEILTEIIDPQNGQPLSSAKGETIFDIVAVVNQLLDFPSESTSSGCKVLKHPLWQTAVYPSLLLSLASVEEIVAIFWKIKQNLPNKSIILF